MNRPRKILPRWCALVLLALGGSFLGDARAEKLLVDFGPGFDLKAVEAKDAKITLATGQDGPGLRIATGHKEQWPGITLKAPGGRWDLSAFDRLTMEIKNVGANPVEVHLRIDSPIAGGSREWTDDSLRLQPGEAKTLSAVLKRKLPAVLEAKLFGMRGNPGGVEPKKGIDVRNVDQLLVFVSKPSSDHAFEIRKIRAAGTNENFAWIELGEQRLFPMIDRFGQFMHKDWPGKTKSYDDLNRRKAEEAAELAAKPGPEDWDQYGGWKAGPQLPATGFFRVEKYQGKWWLVDPEGRLFWSHGVDCVRPNSETPITDRKHWFQELPQDGSPLARFYSSGRWAPHGYYQGKSYETFDLLGANLVRKYGPDSMGPYTDLVHRRLRSWALNTIGNWSSPEMYLARKTAYVATVQSGSKSIEGSSGYWGKFPDPFDPEFKATLKKNLQREQGKSAGDPWCLGYFIDNELSWGDEYSLAEGALASPAEQAAKKVFVIDLKAQFASIEKLNEAWGTNYASWDALLESRKGPDRKKAAKELGAFYTRIAEEYFRLCREAVKEAAPKQLYLGCRFAWVNEQAVRAGAKFCDVVSFNIYRRTTADLKLPQGIDKPLIVGEFHFGALDRGMFHTGLVPTASQAERAAAYAEYVKSALSSPLFVGTHWFQFADQPTTGRGDGENYQIGLIDICDTPYPETIQAVREVGATMYHYRLQAK